LRSRPEASQQAMPLQPLPTQAAQQLPSTDTTLQAPVDQRRAASTPVQFVKPNLPRARSKGNRISGGDFHGAGQASLSSGGLSKPGEALVNFGGWRPAHFGRHGFGKLQGGQLPESILPSADLALTPETRRLHAAIFRGSAGDVRAALRRGAALESSEYGGLTPLHKAAFRGDIDSCRVLLNQAAAVDLRDSSGQTPLHAAALQLQHDTVQLLLRRRADVDSVDYEGTTPARAATARCHRRVEDASRIAMCLEHLTKAYERKFQALNDASAVALTKRTKAEDKHRDAPMFGRLRDEDEEVDVPQLSGASTDRKRGSRLSVCLRGPSHSGAAPAASVQHMDRCTSNSGSPCPCTSGGGFPAQGLFEESTQIMPTLLKASLRGDVDAVRSLLRQSASVTDTDEAGQTALHAAASGAHPAIASLLLKHRANVLASNQEGLIPVRCAVSRLHQLFPNLEDLRRTALTLNLLLMTQEREMERMEQMLTIELLSQRDAERIALEDAAEVDVPLHPHKLLEQVAPLSPLSPLSPRRQKASQLPSCACGSKLVQDAVFCRNCGSRCSNEAKTSSGLSTPICLTPVIRGASTEPVMVHPSSQEFVERVKNAPKFSNSVVAQNKPDGLSISMT